MRKYKLVLRCHFLDCGVALKPQLSKTPKVALQSSRGVFVDRRLSTESPHSVHVDVRRWIGVIVPRVYRLEGRSTA